MSRNSKKATATTMILLTIALLAASLSQVLPVATAQAADDAIVILLASTGGTTNPPPGTYNYANQTPITLQAMPNEGFQFSYWVVYGDYTPGHRDPDAYPNVIEPETGLPVQVPVLPLPVDSTVFTANPANIICGYGYTYQYQAVFSPTGAPPSATPPPQTEPPTSQSAVVRILPAIGGTTNPPPGTYTYEFGRNILLTAIPNEGFGFHYWVANGNYTPGHEAMMNIPQPAATAEGDIDYPASIPPPVSSQDSQVFDYNPANIICGYGYEYTYQAVFTPLSTEGHVVSIPPVPTTSPIVIPTPAPATPTPAVTPTPPPTESGGLSIEIIAAIVVIVIIIIIAVVVVAMRRK